jgi:chorismate-pyruvate lyase
MLQFNDSWDLAYALSERILASSSATFELERWCAERGIGDGHIIALRDGTAHVEALDDDSREAAYPRAHIESRFRRVKLTTAGIVVVDALNWYFPGRLTAEMRELLDTTDVAFGRAIAALTPQRRTFLARRCTRKQLADARLSRDTAHTIFEHRALVLGRDGALLAVVHERFRAALLFA